MCLGPEILLAVQAVAAITAVAGTGYSIVEGQKASDASQKAEKLRQQQMQLELQQKQRAKIREFQLARATTANNIQGSTGTLENSAFQGASSAYSASLGTSLGDISQAGAIGEGIFSANAEYSQASANAQAGNQISQASKELFQSAPAISRLGATNSPNGWSAEIV